MMDINYKRKDLAEYIKKKLGGLVWRIEGFENTDAVEVCIDDAVMAYSSVVPHMVWVTLPPFQNRYVVPDNIRVLSVIQVSFIEPVNRFANSNTLIGLTQNLTGVAPINIAGTTPNITGDVVAFLQWRKTFQRVTSTLAQWFYDDTTRTIQMYNPGSYSACAIINCAREFSHTKDSVKPNHKEWLKRYALAVATVQLGKHRRKFNGSIQGPGGTTMNLDADKLIDEGTKDMEKCEDQLTRFRPMAWPTFD